MGSLLLASQTDGICCVLLGDALPTLLADLQRRFPQARLPPGDERCQQRQPDAVRARGEGQSALPRAETIVPGFTAHPDGYFSCAAAQRPRAACQATGGLL